MLSHAARSAVAFPRASGVDAPECGADGGAGYDGEVDSRGE